MYSCPQHSRAPRGCRKVAEQSRLMRVVPSSSVGLFWMLGTEGLIAGTQRCGTVPLCPAPTHIYLHRRAVLPVRSDLIAFPLLKLKHICLVIIKSWGGHPPAQRHRRAAIASTSVSADGVIEAASAWAQFEYPRQEGDRPCTPSIPAVLVAPLCSPHLQIASLGWWTRPGNPRLGGGSPMHQAEGARMVFHGKF